MMSVYHKLLLDDDVGGAIRQVRITRGMSQRGLAVAAGLDSGYISRVENNKHGLSARNLLRILRALSCNLKVTWRS